MPVEPCDNKRKREKEPSSDYHREEADSASPDLKKGKTQNMKRTPQPTLAQSRLTSTGGTLKIHTTGSSTSTATSITTEDNPPEKSPSMMDTTPAPPPTAGHLVGEGSVPLTADFFRNLIGENTKMVTEKIETLSEDLLTLSKKVDANKDGIDRASSEMAKQAATIADQKLLLDELGERVCRLEAGPALRPPEPSRDKSAGFLKARRSLCVWPIRGENDDDLWRGVGDFIHESLKISEDVMSQDDIESIRQVNERGAPLGNVNAEVLVTFVCPRKRDIILSHASNLAPYVDGAGRPTAGIRLEIPTELDGTFRLLSRFGTRLRARHREGTKRHIKFDDYEASLFINVKLPGDDRWTRISPATARADQENSSREESARILRKISGASQPAVNGPRQRLAVPLDPPGVGTEVVPSRASTAVQRPAHEQQGPSGGPRPRRAWTTRVDEAGT